MQSHLLPPPPILVVDLFPEVLDELLRLLSGLNEAEWDMPTVCAGWSVKDVALHLLGVEVANLSRRRDGHAINAAVAGWSELVAYINRWNEGWVQVARRMSPRVLIDLLRVSGAQWCEYAQTLDPYATGGAVGWAGPQPAPVWLDLAREYTERWHHQQHIRDVVGRPGLKQPRHFAPVLAAFAWAMRRAFAATQAPEGTCLTLTITGESGGRWSVRRESDGWTLYIGAPDHPAAEVVIPEDIAWRLFTRGIDPGQALAQMYFQGDQTLGAHVLDMVSIIA